MQVSIYQDKVWDLFAPHIRDTEDANLYLAAKLASEATELLAVVSNHDFLNKTAFLDEVSDCMWYLTNQCKINGVSTDKFGRESALLFSLEDGVIKFNVFAGKFLGELCKREFHGKKFPDNWIQEQLSVLIFWFNGIVVQAGTSIEEVCDVNIAKLEKRHGASYNKDFYQQS